MMSPSSSLLMRSVRRNFNDTVENMLKQLTYCTNIAAISLFCLKRTTKTSKIFVVGDAMLLNVSNP